jgi:hypothetical protein
VEQYGSHNAHVTYHGNIDFTTFQNSDYLVAVMTLTLKWRGSAQGVAAGVPTFFDHLNAISLFSTRVLYVL